MLSRRHLLAGATGMGAVALAGAAGASAFAGETTAPAPPAARRLPATLATRRTRIESRTRTDVADFTLTHLSVVSSAGAAVRLRTGAGWGGWLDLAAASCGGARDDRSAPTSRRSLVVARDVTGYEVQTDDGSTVAVTELNTADGPAGPVAGASTRQLRTGGGVCDLPAYLSRAAWGADETLRFAADGTELWPAKFYPVQTLTVHHTGLYEHNDDPDPAGTVRAVYYDDCVVDDYGDIGYQLLIDANGAVYEGRVSGDDGFPVYDRELHMANGAHVGSFNAGNIGIVLLGRFTSVQPTPAARESLVKVLALLSKVSGLDPAGTTAYLNPGNGLGGQVRTVQGHRDWAAIGAGPTECPGDAFHPTLESIRRDAAALL
ncbi:peptidoglycan recognition family protein [Catenuloplanes sp. NPDC051500]|uniref:peptidoglycan recognition family protein n=1 Tax=Catenuloplanes sp. NPDC051500 TaxID=3363959 RepID=UPI0037A089F2